METTSMTNPIKSLVSKLMSRREFVKNTTLAGSAAVAAGSLPLPFKSACESRKHCCLFNRS